MPYTDSLAHYYDLSTPVALPDLGVIGGNPGTGANIASNPVGIHGKSTCAEFNGTTSNYNLGDVAELNAVTAFTIAFWMRQNVLDVQDVLFSKVTGANMILLQTTVAGNLQLDVRNGSVQSGYFDYSTAVNANEWAHIAVVFDGSLANANRIAMYVDGVGYALTVTVAIPTVTADMTGDDAMIGNYEPAAGLALDGLLDAFAIFSRPLTQLQVADHMLATRQGRL